jgi:exonuclease III
MDLSIGTWNVRTQYKAGNLRALTQQLDSFQLHIVAIQETKWMGSNIWDTKTHTILQSGKQNGKREFGVAFILDKVTKRNIMAFTPISVRMCTLGIKAKFFSLSIINVHPSTEDSEETEKLKFYSLSERTYDSTPSSDIKIIIIGDLNAKIGREETLRDIIGKESLHLTSNNNGLEP